MAPVQVAPESQRPQVQQVGVFLLSAAPVLVPALSPPSAPLGKQSGAPVCGGGEEKQQILCWSAGFSLCVSLVWQREKVLHRLCLYFGSMEAAAAAATAPPQPPFRGASFSRAQRIMEEPL